MVLLRHLNKLEGLKDISVTTNATLIGPYIDELKELGIKNINVSLDAIDRKTFERITRRDQYDAVHENLIKLISQGFNVRINFIVLEGQNERDIVSILDVMKHYPVAVRFLEEMPFNGGSKSFQTIKWDYKAILKHISTTFPKYRKLESPKTSTSINYQIEGHKSTFGLIPSFSRTFCGSCNRLRITATGDVITCLYGKPKANLRDVLRQFKSKEKVEETILNTIGARSKTGFQAQQEHAAVFDSSMTSIGG
jgi:cyclic pyranopterin phosphate synthase